MTMFFLNAHKFLDIKQIFQLQYYMSSVTGSLDWLVHECDGFGKKKIPKPKKR